jgi:hypothetical protein
MNNKKLIHPEQTKEIWYFKNIQERLYKTDASVWYNKACQQL